MLAEKLTSHKLTMGYHTLVHNTQTIVVAHSLMRLDTPTQRPPGQEIRPTTIGPHQESSSAIGGDPVDLSSACPLLTQSGQKSIEQTQPKSSVDDIAGRQPPGDIFN